MHNGRVLKHGTPRRDRERRRGAGDLHGRGTALMAGLTPRSQEDSGPILRDRAARRLLRPRARAAGGLAHPGSRRARRRRPQRHGQDDAVQRHHRAWCAASRQHPAHAARSCSACRPIAITELRRRLRAAGPPRLAVAHRRRAPAARRAEPHRGAWTVERVYQTFPRLAERKRQRRRRAFGRRAADARDRARAAVQPAPAGDGRADRGAGAGDRPSRSRRC